MKNHSSHVTRMGDSSQISAEQILNALTSAIIGINRGMNIIYTSSAAEQFFKSSSNYLLHKSLTVLIPQDSPIFNLVIQTFKSQRSFYEYDLTLETPKIGKNFINVQTSPIAESPNITILSIQSRMISDKIHRQLLHRSAARSVNGIASMLAHEIKNPLSSIRGAAQLLDQNIEKDEDDKQLTKLIRDESDRICNLVDRMNMFSGSHPIVRSATNIHKILDRVYELSRVGFAKSIRILKVFDPSLPLVLGNQDQLIQVFLNLLKNAAEAIDNPNGEITIKTSYQQGTSLAIRTNQSQVQLPLVISIIDNGKGVNNDINLNLFDPFVTSKLGGSGLGLSLVAKIIDEHGGTVEYERISSQTIFNVMLPTFKKVESGTKKTINFNW